MVTVGVVTLAIPVASIHQDTSYSYREARSRDLVRSYIGNAVMPLIHSVGQGMSGVGREAFMA